MIRLLVLGLAAYGAVKLAGRYSERDRTQRLLPAPGAPKARKQPKRDTLDDEALRLAEETDVSPNQAREILSRHGDAATAKAEAENFKAES